MIRQVLMWGPDSSETATTSPALSRPGSVVAGKFRVERKIAEGGMGVVVAATHIQLQQTVALKFLRADVGAQGDVLARFMREARAAAQLKSEHVARVLDLGITEDGTPYMVMEYLEGQSLADTLRARGPLDIATAAEYGIQTCEGLAEAHARGIVHRDIKPENLFLVERSPGLCAVKILDFGISKYVLSDVPNLATSVIMGSPCYMSPEQLRSTASVDHSADIWSLGATLHELLSGATPFDASQTLPELVTAILEKPAPSLHELRPAVPEELAAIVARCLAKNKHERYENVAQVASALLPFAPVRARGPAERAISMAADSAAKPKVAVSEEVSRRAVNASDASGEWRVGRPSNSQVVTLRGETIPALGSMAPSSLDLNANGQPKGTPRRSAIALAGAAALVLGILVVRATTVAGSSPAQKAAPPSFAAAAAPATPKQLEWAELEVRVSPSSAQITVDGEAVPGNPFRGRYPKDGSVHQVRAIASGYRPKTEDVPLSNAVVLDMSLDQLAVKATWPAVANAATKSGRPVPSPTRADTPALPTLSDVNPVGGQAPLRPIETRNPYGAQ